MPTGHCPGNRPIYKNATQICIKVLYKRCDIIYRRYMYHYNTHSHRLKPREECKDVPQEVRILKTPSELFQRQDNSQWNFFNARTIPINNLFQRGNPGWFRFVSEWPREARLRRGRWSNFGASPPGFPGICVDCVDGISLFVVRKGRLPPQRIEQRREG